MVSAEGSIGGEQGRFAYFDTQARPGAIIEIADIRGPKARTFAHIRRAADGWDGAEPIRHFRS